MSRLQKRRRVNSSVSCRKWTLDSGVCIENGNFGVRHGQPLRIRHSSGDGSGAALGECGGGKAAEEKKDCKARDPETHENTSCMSHCRHTPNSNFLYPDRPVTPIAARGLRVAVQSYSKKIMRCQLI